MKFKLIILLMSLSQLSFAQDDLLDELEAEATNTHTTFSYPTFKTLKIVNLQSTKVASKGDIYLYVSHRFGTIKDGVSTLFGLDYANTKIELLYGITDYLQVAVSRESVRKTYAGSAKLKFTEQSNRFPLNITGYGAINVNTELSEKQYPKLLFFDRLSYASQLLISRRFGDRLSVEVAPTFIRQNLVLEPFQDHNQIALGLGARFKLNSRVSINADYSHNFSRAEASVYKNPLSIGVDLETGGHVFQLMFTNAQSANEPGLITNANGDWSKGDIFFGFNIVRVF